MRSGEFCATGNSGIALDRSRRESIVDAIHRAVDWLLDSGIQETDFASLNFGGVHGYYEKDANRYDRVYPEITGYYLTALSFLHCRLEESTGSSYRRADLRSHSEVAYARLVRHLVRDPAVGVAFGDAEDGTGDWNRRYAFDNAIVLNGMLQHEKYVGTRCESLPALFGWLRGLLEAGKVWTPETGGAASKSTASDAKWSEATTGHLLKCGQAVRNYASRYAFHDADKLWDGLWRAAKTDMEGPRFSCHAPGGSPHTYLHPHMYALEGLYVQYRATGDTAMLARTVEGLRWVQGGAGGSGVPYNYWSQADGWRPRHSADSIAQYLRMCILASREPDAGYSAPSSHVEACVSHLLSMQEAAGSIAAAGGFDYGHAIDGSRRGHINAWATMFAVQALVLYLLWSTGDSWSFDPYELV